MSNQDFANLVQKALQKDAAGGSQDVRGNVRKSMRAFETDVPEYEDGYVPSEGKVAKDDLKPVKRPNGQEYFPRVLGNKTDVDTLKTCRKDGITVMLNGFPGTGKTALIEGAFGADVYTVAGHGDCEVSELVGTYVPDPDTPNKYVWVDGPLVKAMRDGKVLFVDDATLIPATVLARLYPAMDGRGEIILAEHGMEPIKAKKGFFVVAAHNPGAPGAVFSEALASRFQLHIEVQSDLKMAGRLGVHRKVRQAAEHFRTLRTKGEISWAPEMRELLTYQRVETALGTDVAIANLVAACPEEDRAIVEKYLRQSFPGVTSLVLADSKGKV